MPKVSVCIPVYNGEKTIKRTIESVLAQTFSDFECVIVNDGSTDNTELAVQSFSDNRIRYITKSNKGIADTRNVAIETSQGEYIAFIDADDWMDLDCLKLLVEKAESTESEMVVCDYRFVYSDDSFKEMHSLNFEPTSMKQRPELLYEIMPQFWNKLIKKSVFEQSDTQFPNGLVFEDLCYFACLLPSVKKASKINRSFINYVQLDGSIMSGAREIKPTIYDFNQVIETIDQYYNQHGLAYSLERETLYVLNARELIDSIFKNKNIQLAQKNEVIQSILSYINRNYPTWYKNEVVREKLKVHGRIYCLKRFIIDYFLAKNKIKLVLKYFIK